jgi:hypothetical protein
MLPREDGGNADGRVSRSQIKAPTRGAGATVQGEHLGIACPVWGAVAVGNLLDFQSAFSVLRQNQPVRHHQHIRKAVKQPENRLPASMRHK